MNTQNVNIFLARIATCRMYELLQLIYSTGWLSKQFYRLRGKTAKKTDERINLMNEIINGIKVIKMYAWESSFAKLIAKARRYK